MNGDPKSALVIKYPMRIGYACLLYILVLLTDCTSKSTKPILTTRDTTITQENSFSGVFFDSTLLESFIANQKVEDSAANRLRNFYNSRNYQFAWFTEEGLAEQTRALNPVPYAIQTALPLFHCN